jgi:hypothetical protein
MWSGGLLGLAEEVLFRAGSLVSAGLATITPNQLEAIGPLRPDDGKSFSSKAQLDAADIPHQFRERVEDAHQRIRGAPESMSTSTRRTRCMRVVSLPRWIESCCSTQTLPDCSSVRLGPYCRSPWCKLLQVLLLRCGRPSYLPLK